MQIDRSLDFQVIDDERAVAYLRKTGQGKYAAPVAVPSAIRNAVNGEDIALGIVKADQVATVWHVWSVHIPGIVPKKGDVVAEAGTDWHAVRVQELDEGVRWRLTCTKEK